MDTTPNLPALAEPIRRWPLPLGQHGPFEAKRAKFLASMSASMRASFCELEQIFEGERTLVENESLDNPKLRDKAASLLRVARGGGLPGPAFMAQLDPRVLYQMALLGVTVRAYQKIGKLNLTDVMTEFPLPDSLLETVLFPEFYAELARSLEAAREMAQEG